MLTWAWRWYSIGEQAIPKGHSEVMKKSKICPHLVKFNNFTLKIYDL